MKTIKLLMTVVLLAVIVTGCSDDPTIVDPINNPSNGYLVAETYQNGVLSSESEYDGDNRLVKLNIFDDAGKLTGTTFFSYNDKGQLVLQAVHSKDNEVINHEFEYDDKGRVKQSTMRRDAESIGTLNYEYTGNQIIANGWAISGVRFVHTYTIEEGNVVLEEMVYTDLTAANWVKERSGFDDKKYIGGFFYGMINLATQSNPGREKLTTAVGVGSFDWEWRYTYNEDGFVTTATSYHHASGEKIDFFEYKLIPAK